MDIKTYIFKNKFMNPDGTWREGATAQKILHYLDTEYDKLHLRWVAKIGEAYDKGTIDERKRQVKLRMQLVEDGILSERLAEMLNEEKDL